jgi:hypothetical protein
LLFYFNPRGGGWAEEQGMKLLVKCRGLIDLQDTKKDGTNGLAVRAGRPVTQLTSSSKRALRHPSGWNKYKLA